jgi:hypothetical protein
MNDPRARSREECCDYRFQGKQRNDEVWLRAVLLCHQYIHARSPIWVCAECEVRLEVRRSPTT